MVDNRKKGKKEGSVSLSAKRVIDRILHKRIRGKVVTSDFFKEEMPDHIAACIDSIKESSIVSLIFYILYFFSPPHLFNKPLTFLLFFLLFFISYAFFSMSKGIFKGWDKLQRLHRVIQEERYEIEHHRKSERKELVTLYKAKGFSGQLLEDVVDVLMGDDNRLLQIMLEEEMGLALGSYEHPLKIGIFSFLGVLITGLSLFISLYFLPWIFFFIMIFMILTISSIYVSKYERQKVTHAILWNLAIGSFAGFITYFTMQLFLKFL